MSASGTPAGLRAGAPPGLRPITIIGAQSGSLSLDEQNPWPGLASYDEASRAFFRGREAEAAELLRLIKLSPFVTFYGKSGLGKSSVLQAGVFQPLRDAHVLPVHLRLDYAESAQLPVMEQAALRLRQEAAACGADAAEPEPGESLWAYLQRRDTPIWGADNFPLTPVLVFDQFEEVFSRGGSPAHVKRLLDTMADFVAARLPNDLASNADALRRLDLQTQRYHVVLAFRSDFLADVEGWVKRTNLPRPESFHLTAMSRDSAVRAVKAGEAVLEPGVAEQIVDFLLQREVKGDGSASVVVSPLGGDIEPALLSLCCFQLNRKRRPGTRIDAELLRAVGPSILADFYRDAVKDMPPRVARFIEENLILGERYRNPYPREVALQSGGLTEDELNQLTKNRLLRIDPQGDELRIELIHDRLVGVVRESRDARRAHEARETERAAAEQQQREAMDKLQRERDAAEQRMQLEVERERARQTEAERVRVVRGRNRLIVAAAAMTVMIAGLVWQSMRARDANARLAVTVQELNDTAKALNANLEAEKEDHEEARKELEVTKTQLAQALRDKAWAESTRAAQAYAAAPPSADARRREAEALEASARLREAESKLELQARSARAYEASRQALGRQPSLKLPWRLASGGCDRGAVAVSGQAEFTVTPRGNQVEVHEAFSGRGGGFTVTIDSRVTHAARSPGCYDIQTIGTWVGPDRRFTTQGVDHVCVNADGAPVNASITRIRTDCGN